MNINNEPLVSIIMSCYNSERFLEKAISSLIAQTYSNIEIIIVNDGSTDLTDDIIDKYLLKDSRIVYINNINNIRLSKSLNKALKIAKGDYIARMDSDDICMLDRIEVQLRFLMENPKIDIIGSGMIAFGENLKERYLINPLNNYEIGNKIFISSPLYHPTVFFRRTLIDNGLYYYSDEFNRIEDYHLWVKLFVNDVTFANLNSALIKYRVYEESETHKGDLDYLDKIEKMIKIYSILFDKYNIELCYEELYLYVLSMNKKWAKYISSPVELLGVYEKILLKKKGLYFPLYRRWLISVFFSDSSLYKKIKMLLSFNNFSYIFHFLNKSM